MPDAKMKDSKDKAAAETKDKDSEETKPVVPPLPPLEAAARRLERLLGGGLSDKDKLLHTYSNPGKVVRRWLGTASGASGNATLEDIAAAANILLDPAGPCAAGRTLLKAEEAAAKASSATAMDVEGEESKSAEGAAPAGYLSSAADREVESWLLSLSVRILLKEKKYTEAFELAQQAIVILMGHLNTASLKITVSGVSAASLYPLLARLFRFRSLVAESINDPAMVAALRQDMAKAHNMACLRRDVDCQSTLLNLMLRDLLIHSQGTIKYYYVSYSAVKCN